VEYLLKWNVINQWFLKHPVHPVNGQLLAPTEPGLGMDWTRTRSNGTAS